MASKAQRTLRYRIGLIVVTLLLFACAPDHVSRDAWQRMSHDDRVLYIRTLLGAEKAKDAKGGHGKEYPAPPEDYVKQIDDAYARGESRDPRQLFTELGR